MLTTIRPSISQGGISGGGLGVTNSSLAMLPTAGPVGTNLCLGKLSNGWTDWHQIWYTSVDSSRNGHRLNTIRPTIPRGHLGGGV